METFIRARLLIFSLILLLICVFVVLFIVFVDESPEGFSPFTRFFSSLI